MSTMVALNLPKHQRVCNISSRSQQGTRGKIHFSGAMWHMCPSGLLCSGHQTHVPHELV